MPRQDARLHELADLLAEVADALNVAGPQEQAARGILAEFDPARYPEAGEALERILLSAASLHEMAESTAWDAGAADAWKGTLEILRQRCDAIRTEPPLGSGLLGLADALERFLVDTAKQRSAQALALIADTLEVFLERVAQTHGHAVHALKARPVTPEAFDAAKQDPIGVLGQLLERCGFAHAQGLPAAISAARSASGFSSAVADLKTRLGKEEPVAADDLREVVVLLASRLLGLAPSQLPAALVPAVNLYASPVVVLPNVAGLNGVSHQKRKAAFDVATWQLHIPRNVFDAPERLESRLAGLAADVAYAAVSLREDKQFETNHPLFALWYGPLSKRFTNALAAAEVVASSRDFLARHPDSAAAALHAIVQAVRVDDGIEARAWHLGRERRSSARHMRARSCQIALGRERMKRGLMRTLPGMPINRARLSAGKCIRSHFAEPSRTCNRMLPQRGAIQPPPRGGGFPRRMRRRQPLLRSPAAIPLIDRWMPRRTRASLLPALPERNRLSSSTCRWLSGSR